MNQLSAVLEVQMLMLIFTLGVLLGLLFGGGYASATSVGRSRPISARNSSAVACAV